MRCPVCNTDDTSEYGVGSDSHKFDCKRCGEYTISGTALAVLPSKFLTGIHRRALMSYHLRRMSERTLPQITTQNLDTMWEVDKLLPPQEQADQLVLLVGDKQLSPDSPIRLAYLFLSAWIGASLLEGPFRTLDWHIDNLCRNGLLEPVNTENHEVNITGSFQLTMTGWHRYSELKKVQNDSKNAFMAMEYGDVELDGVVSNCFGPAVAHTGFTLRKLTDQQGAGLIDNQLRAAILASRFVIADLTHANNGAYWEAGYAEGLGLPVIYTCKKSTWDKKETHFDTNHMNTIIWNPVDLNQAAIALTATIRATLRGEAQQRD